MSYIMCTICKYEWVEERQINSVIVFLALSKMRKFCITLYD